MDKRLKGNNIRPEINPIISETGDRPYVITNTEKANIFSKTFCKISSDSNFTTEFLKQKQKTLTEEVQTLKHSASNDLFPELTKSILFKELWNTLKDLRNDTAPGQDEHP